MLVSLFQASKISTSPRATHADRLLAILLLMVMTLIVSGCQREKSVATTASPPSTVGEVTPETSPRAPLQIGAIPSSSPASTASPAYTPPAHVIALVEPPERLAPATAPHPYVILADDPNPRAQSILEAHRTGAFPERLSPLVAPKPFNPASWERDPQRYVDVVEPGRVDQIAEDPVAPPIRVIGGHRIISALIGSLTVLRVQALPYAPVSWVTTSGGVFTESKASAVTVRADGMGVATVTYYATPGLSGYTQILAASPYCSGRADQTISITTIALPLASANGEQK